jgi:hypothetical protein
MALAHAAATPARLLEDERSIESNLKLPKGLDPGRYDVYCEVRVMKNGTARRAACYSPDGTAPWKLVDACRKAARRAQFVPATREGKPADVYMVLMVRTFIGTGEPLVLALPNNGIEHSRLGLFYIAPQRFNEFSWGSLAYYMMPRTKAIRRVTRMLVWEELLIDAQGRVTASKLSSPGDAPAEMVDAVRRSVENMEFMPGFVDGKPVEMRYVEPAFSVWP